MASTSSLSSKLLIAVGIALGAALMVKSGIRYYNTTHKTAEAPATGQGLVQQDEQVMTAAQVQWIEKYHGELLRRHDIDLRVVVSNVGDINPAAAKKFEELRVGSKSKTGRGLLLIISPGSNKVRMEVGRSLEGIYTDAFVSYIENRQMVHFFKANRVADGILATTEMLVTRAQDAVSNKEFEPPADTFEASTGAGASTNADIGKGNVSVETSGVPDVVVTGDDPAAVLHAYIAALESQNVSPHLSIYTEATKKMFGEWVVTPAQMDNEAKNYRRCKGEQVRMQGDLAVVRFDVRQRQCSPYFLRREEGAWKLDFTMMQGAISFNVDNEWRLKPEVPHDFGFAFADWHFDGKGFPHAAK